MTSGLGPIKIRLHCCVSAANCGFFAQKAKAGMDGVTSRAAGCLQDRIHVEIAVCRTRSSDADGLMRQLYVQRIPIRRRVDSDRSDPHLLAGADDPNRDLSAVGYQYLPDHLLTDDHQFFVKLNHCAILNEDLPDHSASRGMNLIHDLHRFDDAQDIPLFDRLPISTNGFAFSLAAA